MPRRGRPAPAWDLTMLVNHLRGRVDEIAANLQARLVVEVPIYASVAGAVTGRELAANVDVVLEGCLPDVPAPHPSRLRATQQVGESRARQGFTLDDLLHGWRIGLEVTYEHAAGLCAEHHVPDGTLQAFTLALLHSSDVANSATAHGHRRIDVSTAVASAHWRARLVHALLLGEQPEPSHHADLALLGFGGDAPLRAFCAASAEDGSLPAVLEWLEPRPLSAPLGGLAAVVGPHIIGFVRDPPPRTAPPCPIGVGPVGTSADLMPSLRTARRVLSAARAADLAGMRTADELGLLLPIVDDEVGDALVRRYVTPLQRTQSGRSVLSTVRSYLDNRQQIETVARDVFAHPNTIRYRLRRFEQLTHCDLRDPWSLAEVCWAMRRAQLLETPHDRAAARPDNT